MNASAWKEESVRRSSEWLDADGEECASLIERETPLDEQVLVHIADLQLVDALLSNMSDRASNHKNLLIQRVMESIEDDRSVPESRIHFQRWHSLMALAACLLIVCTLFWVQSSRESRASEVLLEIGEVSLEKTDRVYELRRVSSTSGTEHERHGKLYLRGVEGFVVVCGDVVLGRNLDEFWLVSAHGNVIVSEDFAWLVAGSAKEELELELLKELSIESRHVPLMQLSSVVELMRHDYEVTLRSGVPHGQQRVDELVGKRRRDTSDLPNTIRLRSGTNSRIIHRAELSWEKGKEESQENTLVLELAAAEHVPADWYNHEAHHPNEKPPRRVAPDL